ncbi:MAG: DNA polymerase/3'-5' exonuclease PolX [Bacteroidetes bacterium]|nr:DNA polymerase/3'-5' exonuclease PolX [Bacteroidota bacterium]
MENYEIAEKFKLLSQLMELHNANAFKIRSYQNAAFQIDRLSEVVLWELPSDDLEKLDGIGKSVAAKITELRDTGTITEIDNLLKATPVGVVQMMHIKGIGPKKVAALWRELGIETTGELLYACNENRLTELKGFGEKTQAQIKKAIEFIQGSAGKYHYAALEKTALSLMEQLKNSELCTEVSLTGAIRRKCEILESIELVCSTNRVQLLFDFIGQSGFAEDLALKEDTITFHLQAIPVVIFLCSETDFAKQLFLTTTNAAHLKQVQACNVEIDITKSTCNSEAQIYALYNLPFIEPELREGLGEIELGRQNALPTLIELSDLKGVLHNHSTWSDGIHTLEQMAKYCKELGYSYFGICDHSKSAFYANGLQPERVLQQQSEIDALNNKMAPFKIFKGIESDILSDGSLDYEEDILRRFDFVVASVHSNLKMDMDKATARLIRAIENPYTTILGHPTGRLLLAREGYPIKHKKVIDACAANGVVIELNAHPYRLDMDWRWVQYAIGKGVMISINPDAHAREGFHDMYFGVCVARKGMLTKTFTFNAKSTEEIEAHFTKRKTK